MMENAAAAKRSNPQPSPTAAPAGWAEEQESLAAEAGLAVLLVAGRQPPSLIDSNNNSICQAFQSSPAHAHLCEPYCGRAFKSAHEAGGPVRYRCHAGLHCVATPIDLGTERALAVIGGRTFLRSADYRALAERFRCGDLADLLSADLFRNVIFASRQDLDELAARISDAAARHRHHLISPPHEEEKKEKSTDAVSVPDDGGGVRPPLGRVEQNGRAEISYFTLDGTLKEACSRAVYTISEKYAIESVALVLRIDDKLMPFCVAGQFKNNPPRISLQMIEDQLHAPLGGETFDSGAGPQPLRVDANGAELFPLIMNGEVKGAFVIAGALASEAQRRALSEFCREISLPLEILRLREELERRKRATKHLNAFTEHINLAEPEDAYTVILRHSAELLHAERSSLLLFDETANELAVKAAVGPRAEIAREARIGLGDGVSGAVLSAGRPALVHDVQTAEWTPAPAERSYKTNSFISYPISIGGRKVGVLNVTDKAGGGAYDERDLNLLEMIAPQMALALDRAEWHQKATQFQLLSITDPLTGLLNRRYLEERLSEELERSKRHLFQMCFMMLDIDDFKQYNDQHGHQAGDLALEMTAQCMKSALRTEDVAARYGGEEFSILLPQTNLSEAHVIAERIRRRVERTHFPHGKSQPLGAVTVSIGISVFGPHLDTPVSIIYAADQALYTAKSRGKNCVDSFAPVAPDAPSQYDADRHAK